MPTPDNIIIGLDNNVPVIEGACPNCKRGKRSFVLVNYIPQQNIGESEIYMQCICCRTKYKTKVKYVCDE